MDYLTFLRALHDQLRPNTYLEVGVREGGSLSLSRVRSIGIDPAFSINRELAAPCHVFRTTSDEYFGRDNPLAPFDGAPVDFAFIDGMHLSEFALRDFMNVERHSHWAGVVIFDDMLPRSVAEAARDRHTNGWTGDVYKVIHILRRLRPELSVTLVGTKPTGLMIVHGLDPDSRVLEQAYAEAELECLSPDPQDVPPEILRWEEAVEPAALLESSLWTTIREARESGNDRGQGHDELMRRTRELLAELPTVAPPTVPVSGPWPPVSATPAPAAPAAPAASRPAAATPKASVTAAGSSRPLWRRELSRVLKGVERRVR